MFSQNLSDNTVLDSYRGVDLSQYNCHKLVKDNQIYSDYAKDQLHYVIGAVQKGLKPHTKIGLKRIKTKNLRRKLRVQPNNSIPALNPKSPQLICLKALRTQFRNQLQKNHIQKVIAPLPKTAKIVKRKQHQRSRRNQLIRLVKKYKQKLQPHFGNRLQGYGRCPKVSRKQIKDYLLTLGIEAKLDPVVEKDVKQLTEKMAAMRARGGRRGANFRRPPPRYMRQPRVPVMGMQVPVMGIQPSVLQVPLGIIPPIIPPIAQSQKSQVPIIQNPTPVVNDEDFPSLLK